MDKQKYKASSTDWLYLLFWAILPLIYVQTTVDYTLVPRQLFASVFVIVTTVFSWNKLFSRGALHIPVLFYLGFIAMMVVATFGAIDPIESYATLSRMCLILAYVILTIGALRSGALNVVQLVKGVVVFALIAAAFTLVEIFQAIGSGDFFTNIYTVSATFSHKNLLSSVLLFSIPFAWMGRTLLAGTWKKVSLLLIFVLIGEIFILRTRGVWLSFFMASVATIAGYYSLGKEVKQQMKLPGKLIGLGLGIAVVLMIGFFMSPDAKTSLSDTANLDKRTVFWDHSIEMLKEKPLTGIGPGNWKIYFPKYGLEGTDVSVKQGVTHIQRPHNDYLWVLSEGGPLSLLFYLGVFVVVFIRLRKNLKQAETREDRLTDLAVLFGVVAFMSFSLTDFPMERVSHNFLLYSLVAIAFRKPLKDIFLKGVLPRLIVVFAAGASLIVAGYRWQGEKYSKEVLVANASRNASVMINSTDKALNPFYNMDNFANPLRYYSSLGHLVREDLTSSWRDAQEAYKLHPYNIVVINQMGNVLKARKELDEALKYYDEATDISPRLKYARLGKAEILLNKRQYADAMYELTWMDPSSEDRRFFSLLVIITPKFLEESSRTGRMSKLAGYIRSQNPQGSAEIIQAYRNARASLRANTQ